jgi:hypothetical protein
MNDRILRHSLRLAIEEVSHRRHGVELIRLVRVELEFHIRKVTRPVRMFVFYSFISFPLIGGRPGRG